MNKVYQLSDLEYNAFIEHCKSTETYKKVNLNTYRSCPEDFFRATGEMAQEDEMFYYSNAYNVDFDNNLEDLIETSYFKNGRYYEVIRTKKVKVKGYNGKY